MKNPARRKAPENPPHTDRGLNAHQDGKRSAWDVEDRDTCT